MITIKIKIKNTEEGISISASSDREGIDLKEMFAETVFKESTKKAVEFLEEMNTELSLAEKLFKASTDNMKEEDLKKIFDDKEKEREEKKSDENSDKSKKITLTDLLKRMAEREE